MTASEVGHVGTALPARLRAGAAILESVRRSLAGIPSPVWGAAATLLLIAAIAGWIAVAEAPAPREYFVALPPPEDNMPAPKAPPVTDTTTGDVTTGDVTTGDVTTGDITGDASPAPTTRPTAEAPAVADQDPAPTSSAVAQRETPPDADPSEEAPVAEDSIAAVAPPLPLAEHETVIDTGVIDTGVIDTGALHVAASALVRTDKMVPVPHPDLVEHAKVGPLPRVGPDGRQPWQVYARPFDDADPRPRIAVVIESLGMRRSTTFTAIELPGTVTLAFAPYANGLDKWIELARGATHEILLELPMEPETYPRDDPGPRALLTSLRPDENLDRLDWLLSRFVGYVGVMPFQGSAFTDSPEALAPVARSLRDRGLIYLDRSGSAAEARRVATETGLYWVGLDLRVDNAPSRKTIAARFAEAERLAKDRGSAVVIAQPLPLTVELIKEWLAGFDEKGLAAAPLTAVFVRRASAQAVSE